MTRDPVCGMDVEESPSTPKADHDGRTLYFCSAGRWLARKPVSLAEGDFELRYGSDAARLASMTRRAIALHGLHGLLAIGALIAGTAVILQRGLLAPLRSIARQLDRMRDGGGWLARVPTTDAELTDLAGAVAGLGPGLESQAREWIAAEHRRPDHGARLSCRVFRPRRSCALRGALRLVTTGFLMSRVCTFRGVPARPLLCSA